MKKPEKVLRSTAVKVDSLKPMVKAIHDLQISVSSLRILIGIQMVGTDLGRLKSYLAALQKAEAALAKPGNEDIDAMFAVLKHLSQKTSDRSDA